MKNLTKIAALAVGAALAAQSVHAQVAANDIILGFDSGSASLDYQIDLGQATTAVGVGGTVVKDLSTLFSATTFSSVFSSANGTAMGAGGGKSGLSFDLYAAQTRAGGAGTASVAGSSAPANNTASSGSALKFLGVTGISAGTSATPSSTASGSWSPQITTGTSSLKGSTGLDVTTAISGLVAYEDLWFHGSSGAWIYKGYLTLNLNNDGTTAPDLTFTPVGLAAVPEPATYGLIGGAGLLLLSLRRKLASVVA